MARKQQYVVHLAPESREYLLSLLNKGTAKARVIRRANIVRLAADGCSDQTIGDTLHVAVQTVRNIRKRFATGGLDAALYDAPRPGGARKLTAKQEAYLIALACSEPPAGRECWTMQLLADRIVEWRVVDCVSDETVRRALKKMRSNLCRRSSGVSRR
jgi:transposase